MHGVRARGTGRHGAHLLRLRSAVCGEREPGGEGGSSCGRARAGASDRGRAWAASAGWLGDPPEVEILFPTGESAVPDLSGWRLDRVAGDALEENPVTVVPDWICEIFGSGLAP